MAGLSGKTLGGFRILGQVDEESGQGIVCKAVCEVENPCVAVRKGQVVALKVMPVHNDERRQQWRRLENRTKELARIDHPNVVRYHGCFCEQGEWNQLHVIVQEFLEGETLKDRLKRHPSGLDVDEGLKIASLALEGLAHTASKGIVHRDIKPGNIFICEKVANGGKELSVKLIDFEVAKQGQGSTTASTGNLRGSFNYMAPEFLDARFRGDLLSDVFSMGVTLHEMLTGKLPYDLIDGNGEDAILDFVARWKGLSDGKNPVLISPDANRLLAHTDKLFSGCLSPSRERRFGSFEEFREALGNVRFRTLTNPAGGSAYQMLQFVGKGGFGEVFKARETKTGRVVAIKHLRKAKYADRFKREAKILSRLDDDCFVRFVESFSRDMDGKVQEFLVMGFLDGMPGCSLWDAIKKSRGAGLPKKDVFTAFMRYARGLRMLHAAGVFHRDIKPSNLYFPAGRPELAAIMDLGIARDTKGTMTAGSIPGTPDYMPPETVTAGSRGESGMDVYALGLCMYEALTAKSAFARLPPDIEGFRKLVERANSRTEPNFDDGRIDAGTLELLADMTAFNPEDRIKDVREVERRLKGLLAKLVPAGEPVPRQDRRGNGILKKRLVLIAAVAGAAALVCCALSFALPAAKRFYAEKRFAEVLDSYKNLDPRAEDKENAWIVDFNPQSHGRLRLDEAVFAKCTNEIHAVKNRVRADRLEKEWLERIGQCLPPDGRLAIDAFGRLDGLNLPDALAGDGRIGAKLSELARAIKDEFGALLSIGDVKSRRRRLKSAGALLANSWTAKLLGADETERIKKSVDKAEAMCVGSVHNGSGGEIEVCGVKIGVGETKTVIVEDGRPGRRFVNRRGFYSIPLPTGFDGMDFRVDDTNFVVEPGKVSVPEHGIGVRCIIDGIDVKPGVADIAPGSHVCVYEKVDSLAQTNSFEVMPGETLSLPAPRVWQPTEDVVRLRTATGLSKQKLWAEVEKAIQGIKVARRENLEELERLKTGVSAWKSEEERRHEKERIQREAEKKEFIAKIDKLLETEPVAGRRERLANANKLLAGEAAGLLLGKSELLSKRSAVEAAMKLAIGRIKNGCDFVFSVNGVDIPQNESRIVQYDKERAQGVVAKARGYEDLTIGKELDGAEIVVSKGRWIMADVPVKLSGMAGDVECLRNGERINGDFTVKPGRYELLFKRRGYAPQVVRFEARIAEGCAVEAPRDWEPLPVEVSLPDLQDGVRCFLDRSEVAGTISLKPGRSYEFRYEKDDCANQRVELFVEAGTPAVVPAPSVWVDTEDAGKLSKAEYFFEKGDLEEAAKLIDNIVIKASANQQRLAKLKKGIEAAKEKLREKQQKDEKIKEHLRNIDIAYHPGRLMLAGAARDCVKYYCEAVSLGHTLDAEDCKRIEYCYKVGMQDLEAQERAAQLKINKGENPFRPIEEIREDARQLRERYNKLSNLPEFKQYLQSIMANTTQK